MERIVRNVVVGVGSIGSQHARHLRDAGHDVFTVDVSGAADGGRVSDVGEAASVDAWVVATPTASHLGVVREILSVAPEARILLEKPACHHEDLSELADCLRQHPGSRVIVNDVYGLSPAVRSFIDELEPVQSNDPISKIIIEFTKNRQQDVANGRFVDTEYGDAGYEWFHMLSLLGRLLPRPQFEAYLKVSPGVVTPEIRTRVVLDGKNLVEIDLYASVRGQIAFGQIAGSTFSSPEARRIVQSGHIPYGSELRYRIVHVLMRSGASKTLVFEPEYKYSEDYKNVHVIRGRGFPEHRYIRVSTNHFKHAVIAQIDRLMGAGAQTDLREAEHFYMAMLARWVRTSAALSNSSDRREFVHV
ncbi:hypothetical protein [Streptomyces sp. V1I1]|uniref:hypothetical protein n=1 Tax=Streptomyces sp. V1I1 TaxID=3042272 RepID=UPI0027869623|nr:hypothetical protein [Streptomyces sp. V1I1]MDQ0946029.1 hypothetical protein [Streptomyces sp. V1I1]